jgi:succinate dehydrogenase / fumarate reductase cytochrome b subunit
MNNIFVSSIGKKLMMSLAGLFLISFLAVHLAINLTLVFSGSRELFNKSAYFMGTNIVLKVMEIVLFGGFLLHMIFGTYIQIQNWFARPQRYSKENFSQTSFFSKFMIHTAAIITVFLVIHLMDFYFKAKILGNVPQVIYGGKEYHDLGNIACFLFLGFHLWHGFWSAFQTLGLDHRRYTPLIKALGIIYTVVITGGFIYIPIFIYFWM